jgi:hypothetical protein
MIVLSNTADEQTFTVIPRFEPSGDVTVKFTSETQNKETHSFAYAASYSNGYLTIVNTFDPVLKLNTFYSIKVLEGSDLVWRGRCFATDQTDYPKFTVNDGKFEEYQDNNNEFITI